MAFNRTVPASLIEAIYENKQFVEVMIAPDFEPAALELLAEKPNLRVLQDRRHAPHRRPLRESARSRAACSCRQSD